MAVLRSKHCQGVSHGDMGDRSYSVPNCNHFCWDDSGSITQGWSVDVEGLSVTRRGNRAGTGFTSVTVHDIKCGAHHKVAYTSRAREGHMGCDLSEWESKTCRRCLVGHGARSTHHKSGRHLGRSARRQHATGVVKLTQYMNVYVHIQTRWHTCAHANTHKRPLHTLLCACAHFASWTRLFFPPMAFQLCKS